MWMGVDGQREWMRGSRKMKERRGFESLAGEGVKVTS